MAYRSDQIQADIARTRARMATRIDHASAGGAVGSAPANAGSLTDQIRQRPLLAAGLSLVAAALLQDYLGSSQTSVPAPAPVAGYAGAAPPPMARAAGAARHVAASAVDTAGTTADAVAGAAGTAVDAAVDTAANIADSVTNAAGVAVDAATGAARQVADTTVYVADNAVDFAGEAVHQVQESTGDLFSFVSTQIRTRPLVALGFSLAAGSMLNDYLAQSRATGGTYGTMSAAGTVDAYGRARNFSGANVGHTAASAMHTAGHQASHVARQTATGTQHAVGSAADAAVGAAGAVADTASDVAGAAVDAVSATAGQVVDTASDAASYVAGTVSNLPDGLIREVYERPLTAVGVAVAAGMLLRPSLAPHISSVTRSLGETFAPISGGIADTIGLPEHPETRRMAETIVPATLERARDFTNHQLRDYLEESLASVVGQTSLRAGVVAAATEKADAVIEGKLPDVLQRSLTGTRGLLLLALAGALLRARDEVRQGQGQTLNNIKSNLAESLVQTTREQLMRYFPEFREEYQSSEQRERRCTNCDSPMQGSARFCPNCGTPA